MVVIFVMKIKKRCYKFKIDNGPIVDLTPNIIEKVIPYLQLNGNTTEAGGCLVGFENHNTSNITLNDISLPGDKDIRNRVFCKLRDKVHKIFLNRQIREKNFYMGNWHTHPQTAPTPSTIDISDWKTALHQDRTGCSYIFFIIFGTDEFKVWYGDFANKRITELKEMKRQKDFYVKE